MRVLLKRTCIKYKQYNAGPLFSYSHFRSNKVKLQLSSFPSKLPENFLHKSSHWNSGASFSFETGLWDLKSHWHLVMQPMPTVPCNRFLDGSEDLVTEHKFVCLTHSEAKPTKTGVWRRERFFFFPPRERFYYRVKQGERVAHALNKSLTWELLESPFL